MSRRQPVPFPFDLPRAGPALPLIVIEAAGKQKLTETEARRNVLSAVTILPL